MKIKFDIEIIEVNNTRITKELVDNNPKIINSTNILMNEFKKQIGFYFKKNKIKTKIKSEVIEDE